MPISKKLEKEFNYYVSHQQELVEKHNGKFIVIKGEKILGAYDKLSVAFSETKKDHKEGTFLIQFCSPGNDAYTQTFHSRVSFQ